MKIKRINIESYRHLQNIDFDFTYPEGHEKVGKPLEKICIIGQSATGKTSVLELIKDSISKIDSIQILNNQYFLKHFQLELNGSLEFLYDDRTLSIATNIINYDGKEYKNFSEGSGTIIHLFTAGLKLLYLSTDIISKEVVNIFNQNPTDIFATLSIDKYSGFFKSNIDFNYIFEFTQEINTEIWFSLLYKILDYKKRFNQWSLELLGKGIIGDLMELNKKILEWSKINKNPLIDFAEYFNPLLNKLNLEIDLFNAEFTIPIKSKIQKKVIPISGLSTGTKGLLLSMFPLYELDTMDALILIDEPERSLFPDMQIDLMSHYRNLAPNAQFIVATHSPFIAAAFEPEERFILYFNDEGNVAVRRGESPIGDDPNDMLTNDFQVDYYNEVGKSMYEKYISLKQKLANEKEFDKKKDLLVEMTELGNKYNF